MGIKEFKQLTWEEKLKELEDWILENKRKPSYSNKNNNYEIQLIKWYDRQEYNYKNNYKIMKYEKYKILLDEFKLKYSNYFVDKKQIWLNNLNELEKFINLNLRLPTDSIKSEKKLNYWMDNCKRRYKDNECIFIEYEEIKNIFKNFLCKYKEYYMTNEEKWINNLNLLKEYIDLNKKLPNDQNNGDKYYSLTNWISYQKKSYLKNINCMQDEKIKKIWEKFLIDYDKYFIKETNEDIWINKLNDVINFINKNSVKPSKSSNCNKEKKLCSWINSQNDCYKNKIKIMKNENIRNTWKNFTEKYNHLFLNNYQEWELAYNKLINFIEKNNKKPSKCSKDLDEKTLALWFRNNKKKYINKNEIMKDINIYNKWDELIKKYPILN